MIAFNIVSCVLSCLILVGVALLLEDRLRTFHRFCLTLMAATMVVSTWAAIARINGVDGWVFICFRLALMGHLLCEYVPRLRQEIIDRLQNYPGDRTDLSWVEGLRWLAAEVPPYNLDRAPTRRRP